MNNAGRDRRGARDAAARGDLLVVVDTLSFSTAVVVAAARGAVVHPCGRDDDPEALAARLGAELAVVGMRDGALRRLDGAAPRP